MPIAKTLRRGLKYVYGALAALYLSAPVYAFTPSQVPLLSASAVTPNVMLQVDNSGSMDTIIFDSGFNASASWPTIDTVNCNFFRCERGYTIPTGDGQYVFLSALTKDGCTSGYSFAKPNNGTIYCVALPDPARSGTTRYPGAYLSYLVSQVSNGNSVANIPTESRLTSAISVALGLVDANRSLRIGLATYNPPNNNDRGPGGNIKQVIADLSPVPATSYQSGVTQATADTNYRNLRAAISALTAEANTPLAETYYQVTRYFRGLTPFPSYTNSPTTFTSPIQYRCQKNYGVVLTDGLPTYDKLSGTSDVDDPNRYLPNWDRVNNDGPNTNEANEGDTLYLDDIAKFAYDIDMRKDSTSPNGDLTGRSWDNAGFTVQNMSTYTIGFTLDNQMLIDAAKDTYGHGKYFQANDSAGLNTALNLALTDIYAKAGSGGGGVASSSTLQAGTQFYQTLYDPTDWHGTVRAFNLNATTGALSAPVWTTDSTIVSGSTAPVFESWSTGAIPSRITLDYANFSPAQRLAFTSTLPTGVTGPEVIAWAKGTANAKLRARTRLLGDIINSTLGAGLPTEKTATDLVGDNSYTDYLANKNSNMTYSLLANANDGFFNVINASNGVRRYAYMPSTSLSSLATISATNYGSGVHRFTVDGQIAVFDTQSSAGSAWRTVAYSGLGAGGKAFFAIRLFEGTNNTPQAMWEVKAPDTSDTNNRFNNLGYSYSKPDVARMADGTGIVVVGNGYGSFTGRASLYVLNANTGAFITEIQTPLVVSGETDNGLSSVKLRVNSQNVVQAAYAGDLKGRMWKFDMSGAAASSWRVAFNGSPLFTAPRGANQPITVQPLLLDHPLNGKLVYFGTGKFSEATDKQTSALQDFYAIWDAESGNIVEGNLQAQAITGSVTGNGYTYFTSTNNDVDWGVKKGWYLPLATAAPYLGERIIYPAQTSRGRIIFTTASVNSTDPCESTGTGRLFELDPATGGMLNYQVLDTNGDNDITSGDTIVAGLGIGTGIPVVASIVAGTNGNNDNKYLIDSSGGTPIKLLEKGGSANVFQRIMWRQIQ
ncbi:type IV pilus-associated protein [Pseudomonas cichorii]|uniref:pilus assembly protein n=1 Tax=Pseudomonas cichorii TaxID=36746 RepID=UPI0019108F18|nr:PilC/PilY family type IV pilus protein [Pseudomonas cichorii]GFM83805.1 type IV pilus-associated protein [Pseudomonas cichorii]